MPEGSKSAVVVLYARPGCHLCDEARELILEIGARTNGFELREVDIETDDALLAAYLDRIPVIEIDGVLVGELEPDVDAISRALGTFER